jgi:hypothetical protein
MHSIFYGTSERHTILDKDFQMFAKLGAILLLENRINHGKKQNQV